jgi:hypothetical protein
MGAPRAFALLIGLFWASLGGTLGYGQPVTWPTLHAIGRWARRLLVWCATLSVVAVAGLWFSRQLSDQYGLPLVSPSIPAAILAALAAAMLPAAIREIQTGRSEREGPVGPARQLQLKPLVAGVACAALMVLVVAGGRALGPIVGGEDVANGSQASRLWVGQRWVRFEGGINDFLDEWTVRYHDRRAPSLPTPASAEMTPIEEHTREVD